jgi:hypothetical protein
VEKDSAEVRERSYRKASKRRAEILSRAIELFAERGVDTSLRSIGDAIGVSHAALRYYFASASRRPHRTEDDSQRLRIPSRCTDDMRPAPGALCWGSTSSSFSARCVGGTHSAVLRRRRG